MSFALRKTLLVTIGAALVAGLPVPQAAAATATTTFSVTATVVTTCAITATNLNFGNYSGVVLAGTSTLNATCSTGTPYTISLNAGTGIGSTVTSRKMTGPGVELLNYGLFQDAGHTINWGDTAGTEVPGVGSTAVQPHTVFGQIPASQFIQSGAYSDTITATLTF
jgi:spore coat protein U domain-containing protein, fimbrial subunit CupE1/2/3/6